MSGETAKQAKARDRREEEKEQSRGDAPESAKKDGEKKAPEILAAERLQRNGYSDAQIEEALARYSPEEILARRHRLECGHVGHGEHGALGANELKP
jgi:hypothetical protein